jgi:hypothetical protein
MGDQSLNVRARLEYDWDAALTKSEENPFPLAPKSLVEAGIVDSRKYKIANDAFGAFVAGIMLPELANRTERQLSVLSFGLGRDTRTWLPDVVHELDYQVTIVDSAKAACDNAKAFRAKHNLSKNVKVVKDTVERALVSGKVKDGPDVVMYAGQLIQNFDIDTMRWFMRRLRARKGTFYMLHARGEENLVGQVEWRNTHPYQDYEWQRPLRENEEAEVEVSVLGKHSYFGHHHYTIFRIHVK